MIDNLTTQQRMLLAIVLSFIFFVAYDYFVMPKQTQNIKASQIEQNSSAIEANKTIAAPKNAIATPNVTTNETKAPANETVSSSKNIVTIKSKNFEADIDELGRVSKFQLLNEVYESPEGIYPNLVSPGNLPRPMEIRFSDPALNQEAFKVPYVSDKENINLENGSGVIVLSQKLSKTTVTKTITFFAEGNYKIDLALSENFDYFISPGFRPDMEADMYTFHGALIKEHDDTLTLIDDGDATGNEVYPKASIAATVDRYFAAAFYDFKDRLDIYISKDSNSNPLVFVKGAQNLSLNGYIGPKNYDKLSAIDEGLTDIIEYGFITFFAKPVFLLLKYIHGMIGNWGWSIVIMTLLIRFVLYPLTYKGMVSMNKLKEIAPKIKEVQKQYKGEPQKMNTHMMELYKKHGANPMGGCLPMLMQIPIFFAIYRVLLNAVELKHAPWMGWIQDLAVMDPYYILPVLMGASMFWQQRITPTNFTDPMQEKIMKFLPIIFTFFFITFPAGLTLYWFINNIFSVAQQYYVNHVFAKKKLEKQAT